MDCKVFVLLILCIYSPLIGLFAIPLYFLHPKAIGEEEEEEIPMAICVEPVTTRVESMRARGRKRIIKEN